MQAGRTSADSSLHRSSTTTCWAVLRLLLGTAQMVSAVIALLLIVQAGIGPLALGAVVVTSVLTTTSILLFGRRMPPRS